MTGIVYGATANDAFTIAQPVDSNSVAIPCAYTFTMASNAVNATPNAVVNVRVSAAGLGVFSEAGAAPSMASFPNATAVAMSTNAVGLFIPVQTLPTPDQLVGTSYGMILTAGGQRRDTEFLFEIRHCF